MHQNMTHANLWHIGFTMTPCVCLFPKSSSFNCILSRVSDFRPSKMWVVWISVYFSQFLLKSIPLNDQNCHTNCIEEKLGLLRNCRGAPWLIGNIKRQASGQECILAKPPTPGPLDPSDAMATHTIMCKDAKCQYFCLLFGTGGGFSITSMFTSQLAAFGSSKACMWRYQMKCRSFVVHTHTHTKKNPKRLGVFVLIFESMTLKRQKVGMPFLLCCCQFISPLKKRGGSWISHDTFQVPGS